MTDLTRCTADCPLRPVCLRTSDPPVLGWAVYADLYAECQPETEATRLIIRSDRLAQYHELKGGSHETPASAVSGSQRNA